MPVAKIGICPFTKVYLLICLVLQMARGISIRLNWLLHIFKRYALVLILLSGSGDSATAETESGIPPTVNKFLTAYCVNCHSAEKPKAGFRIDTLFNPASVDANLSAWNEILGRLNDRDMPPKGKPRPNEQEYEAAISAIRKDVERVEEASLAKRQRAMRRLNRVEYANTVRDMFGIHYRPGEDFPADGSLYGFDTVAEGLTLSPALVEKYLNTANTVLDRAFRPVDPNLKPRVNKSAFYEEHYLYPKGASVSGVGVYNGNAHLSFGPEGKKRIVYIGGPAIFVYGQIDPVNNPAHATNSEGLYRLRVNLTPRNFAPGEVASFTILGTEKRLVTETDCTITENGKRITLEAESYYDRSESLYGFEINWTNGNHLQEPSRGRLLKLPFDNSDQNKPWWHINYRISNGKRVEWHPQSPEELPFSYFEKVEFEISGPFREVTKQCAELLGSYEKDRDAKKVFERFLPRAFRRPVTKAEVERFTALVRKQLDKGLDPLEALKLAMAAALCSPHFLLLVEAPPKETPPRGYTLTDHELAARLSYFLWSSCPDEQLRILAATGKLRDKATLNAQVSRMLADPKAKALADGFARQWLNLDKLASIMPEPKLFPNWSEDLRDSCRDETIAFFREVLSADRPVTDFLASDWTFVNEKLADHYGLPAVSGRRLRKIKLPDDRRGGLISQAAVLTLTSEATRTSPVIRGAYVLDRLFHRPPAPPPPNVGALIPDASSAKSVREHLNIHRANPACAECHAKFDGYGLALENFDATGRWRIEEPTYEDPAKPVHRKEGEKLPAFKIDTAVELADGSRFEGVAGLKKHLLARKTEFTRGLAERLTIYACGRGLNAGDRPGIEEVIKLTAADGDKFQSLIRAVVNSTAFRTK